MELSESSTTAHVSNTFADNDELCYCESDPLQTSKVRGKLLQYTYSLAIERT